MSSDATSDDAGLVSQLAAKAAGIADNIGGDTGFGGMMMAGYDVHTEDHMGFHSADDLADADDVLIIELQNDSNVTCTFHVVSMASHMDLENQSLDVEVPAGEKVTAELPCSEIIGMGHLEVVGEVAVECADGTQFDNVMSIPAFLGADYDHGDTYHCYLTVDVDDLDGDGDREELLATTEALHLHVGPGGISGHGHMGGGMHGF